MIVILDLDNCIADDSWRQILVDYTKTPEQGRYDEYHRLCGEDPSVNLHKVWHWQSLGAEFAIITGRPVTVRDETMYWLMKHFVPFKHLLMRNVGEHTPAASTKVRQLGWLLSGEYGPYVPQDIAMAFDDRQDVLDAYKAAYGIPTERLYHIDHILGH